MNRLADHSRLKEQLAGIEHHRRLMRTALCCLFAVLVIVVISTVSVAP